MTWVHQLNHDYMMITLILCTWTRPKDTVSVKVREFWCGRALESIRSTLIRSAVSKAKQKNPFDTLYHFLLFVVSAFSGGHLFSITHSINLILNLGGDVLYLRFHFFHFIFTSCLSGNLPTYARHLSTNPMLTELRNKSSEAPSV